MAKVKVLKITPIGDILVVVNINELPTLEELKALVGSDRRLFSITPKISGVWCLDTIASTDPGDLDWVRSVLETSYAQALVSTTPAPVKETQKPSIVKWVVGAAALAGVVYCYTKNNG